MIRLSSILFGLACAASCSAVDLAWDAATRTDGATNAVNHRLAYGTRAGQYVNSITIGQGTNASVMLPPGRYYFAVYAESDGLISDYSNEVEYEFAQPTTINIGTLIIR